jgi:hypothetical protein
MVGPNKLFFGDTGLQIYEHCKKFGNLEDSLLYKSLGPDRLVGVNLYLDTFNGIYLKDTIVERIKKDFLYIKKKMPITSVREFFRCGYLFRSGTAKIQDIDIFGSSILNPLVNIDTELPIIIYKYNEAKVYKYTGLTLTEFINKTKKEQEVIVNTLINIEVNDKSKLADAIGDLGE